ncbi:Uncharacterised protein [Serratia quinivorans]|nr:hypothetical protein [Serratia quinivorans]CAI1770077.1 Uncharacterised protein [Serratia quinivorans]
MDILMIGLLLSGVIGIGGVIMAVLAYQLSKDKSIRYEERGYD